MKNREMAVRIAQIVGATLICISTQRAVVKIVKK